jgi:hypothetical protein
MNLIPLLRLVASRVETHQLVHELIRIKVGGPKAIEMYEGFVNNTFTTEEEAAKALFNSDTENKFYIRVRSALRNALLSAFFHFDYRKDQFPEMWKAEYDCNKLLFQAKIFIREGERQYGVSLLDRVVADAEPYSFTNILMEAYGLLRSHSGINGKVALVDFYSKKLEALYEQHNAENEINRITHEAQANTLKSAKNRKQYMATFYKNLKRAEEIKNQFDTPFINNAYFFLSSTFNYYVGNFSRNLVVCNQMEEKYETLEGFRNSMRYTDVIINKAGALLRLGRYKEGIGYINQKLNHFVSGSPNWYLILEEKFMMAMYSGDYLEAADLLRSVAPWRKELRMTELTRERWILMAAYLSLVQELPSHYQFYTKYFTENVEISKDKMGYNLAILILQIVHKLKKRDLDGATYAIQALNKLLLRAKNHLDKPRLNSFMQLLTRLSQYGHDAEELEEQTKRNLKKLYLTQPFNNAYSENEVIPYEHLWELVKNSYLSTSAGVAR